MSNRNENLIFGKKHGYLFSYKINRFIYCEINRIVRKNSGKAIDLSKPLICFFHNFQPIDKFVRNAGNICRICRD